MNATPSEGNPNLLQQFFKIKLNWLLIFVPIAIALDKTGSVPSPVLFFIAGISIIPVSALIVRSTEQLATRTGDAIGGLLNATFGNAPELIIGMVALKAGYPDMVRGALIGGILANLLLALGAAFFVGGLRHHDQRFNPVAAHTYSTMMFLAAVSMAVPSTFSQFFEMGETVRQEQLLGVSIAGLLLVAYALYLVFSLKTHPREFESVDQGDGGHDDGPQWGLPRAIGSLIIASVLAAWMSEILVGAAEETGKALGMSDMFIGIVFLAVLGGAAESVSAIAMARKNKVDLSVSVALGSCIQIALFIAPVLVFASYLVAPAPLELAFSRPEVGGLFIAVLIGALVCGDGHSNWFKGIQLMAVYAIIALMFYFMPVPGH